MLGTQEGLECDARESKVKEFHQKALALLNLHLPTSTPNLVRDLQDDHWELCGLCFLVRR